MNRDAIISGARRPGRSWLRKVWADWFRRRYATTGRRTKPHTAPAWLQRELIAAAAAKRQRKAIKRLRDQRRCELGRAS